MNRLLIVFSALLGFYKAQIAQQEVKFDQCGCRDGVFPSSGETLTTSTFGTSESNSCGEVAPDGFPLSGGLEVPLDPIVFNPGQPDWALVLGLRKGVSTPQTLVNITDSEGLEVDLTIDEELNVLFNGLTFPAGFDDDSYDRILIGILLGEVTICLGSPARGLAACSSLENTPSEIIPQGAMDVTLLGSTDMPILDLFIAEFEQVNENRDDLISVLVPDDNLPIYKEGSLDVTVKAGESVTLNLNDGFDTEGLANSDLLDFQFAAEDGGAGDIFTGLLTLDSFQGSLVLSPDDNTGTKTIAIEYRIRKLNELLECSNVFSFTAEVEPSVDVALIVGASVGGVALVGLAAAGIVVFRRRKGSAKAFPPVENTDEVIVKEGGIPGI